MPYKVEETDGKYAVVNTDTGETRATHDTREEAERQVTLLHHVEKEFDTQESE